MCRYHHIPSLGLAKYHICQSLPDGACPEKISPRDAVCNGFQTIYCDAHFVMNAEKELSGMAFIYIVYAML
jgi:hypothetical protein